MADEGLTVWVGGLSPLTPSMAAGLILTHHHRFVLEPISHLSKISRSVIMSVSNKRYIQGRRPRGDGPPKFEVGDGPCIGPPNILRSRLVLSDVREGMNRV